MKRVAPLAVSILGVIKDLQKVARQTTGCSRIQPPFSRANLICFLAETHCEVYEVPLDLGTTDMGALHIEHRTL